MAAPVDRSAVFGRVAREALVVPAWSLAMTCSTKKPDGAARQVGG
jgi:hypothetical protein